jgi:hypothetical protein
MNISRNSLKKLTGIKTSLILLTKAGLTDGILSYQKSKFRQIMEGLGMENVGIFLAIRNT